MNPSSLELSPKNLGRCRVSDKVSLSVVFSAFCHIAWSAESYTSQVSRGLGSSPQMCEAPLSFPSACLSLCPENYLLPQALSLGGAGL